MIQLSEVPYTSFSLVCLQDLVMGWIHFNDAYVYEFRILWKSKFPKKD